MADPVQADLAIPFDVPALLRQARTLERAAGTDSMRTLLRGKNLGLVCDSPDTEAATLFRDAAARLGAHVAHVRPNLSRSSTPQEVQHTARMLGRLYDALECQGMPAALVAHVGREAGVPVYDGIALPDHPTASLARALGMSSAEDAQRCVVQAILLNSIA